MPYESGHDANGLAAIARAMREQASASAFASAPAVAQAADGVTPKKSKALQQVGSTVVERALRRVGAMWG